MNSVHITLQGKGGVGKSFISSLIAQYLRSQDKDVTCLDTDPVNATFAGYKALGVERVELMDAGTLDQRRFDEVIERIVETDSHFVLDNGASSFLPLSSYLVENDAINLIANNGKQVVVHTVITGGQALLDTLGGFVSLAEQLAGNVRLVVWLNEYFGDIEADGKSFEEMQAYIRNKDRVHGIVRIARQTSSTFGKDVGLMLDAKLTFDEVDAGSTFGLMAKQRLRQVKRSIFEQLDAVL